MSASSNIDLGGLALAPDDARKLQALIEARLAAQERELADAVERSLGIVPRLLRGPIKKVLGL
ncbi:hypothetical protein RM530_00355 [Algiphilus sp. W345]|uniref:Uncharacterized protein n=1 Tax=Banduia mediterranea TaxID=3075609 RepID=A0ABU2WE83_9GAMM|nr:hypothetical protein [Algiphilus sp. W345]MDT0495820.1 hypothetical protein [Algiphilus sp. W345]